jgi:hypothetical protein
MIYSYCSHHGSINSNDDFVVRVVKVKAAQCIDPRVNHRRGDRDLIVVGVVRWPVDRHSDLANLATGIIPGKTISNPTTTALSIAVAELYTTQMLPSAE